MPQYRRNNYNFVVDSSFTPLSMSEVLAPLVAYKEAYDETENAYADLSKGAGVFSYLDEVAKNNPESKAGKIYKGYTDQLNQQAEDFAKHGLSLANKRALTDLKRRYQGEIGRLETANQAFQEERQRRLNNKDTSTIYGIDNLTIDDFLDNAQPNLYSVSGKDLYNRGREAAQQISSRVYEDTRLSEVNNRYQELIQTVGYSPELIDSFRQDLSAVPQLQTAIIDILKEYGVSPQNLQGANLDRATQSVINGVLDGIIYKQVTTPKETNASMTEAQRANITEQQLDRALTAASKGLVYNKETGNYEYHYKFDPKNADKLWIYEFDENGDIATDENGQFKFSPEGKAALDAGKIDRSGNTTKPSQENQGPITPDEPKIEIPKKLHSISISPKVDKQMKRKKTFQREVANRDQTGYNNGTTLTWDEIRDNADYAEAVQEFKRLYGDFVQYLKFIVDIDPYPDQNGWTRLTPIVDQQKVAKANAEIDARNKNKNKGYTSNAASQNSGKKDPFDAEE